MIQCIVSDIDGTLLPSGQYALDEEVLQTAAEAVRSGRLFAAASGRPYRIMKRLWEPVSASMAFICANGTLIMEQDRVVYENALETELALQIAESVCQAENCEVLLTCPQYCYIRPKKDSYRRRIQETMQYPVKIAADFRQIKEKILQVSAFREDGIEKSSPDLIQRWEQQTQAVVSGKFWMDFTAQGANKGSALLKLMKLRGLQKENVMALGDSYNDISMFQAAGTSYAMAWSPEAVKAQAGQVTGEPLREIQNVFLK